MHCTSIDITVTWLLLIFKQNLHDSAFSSVRLFASNTFFAPITLEAAVSPALPAPVENPFSHCVLAQLCIPVAE